jgi:RHS repeat-associated protein
VVSDTVAITVSVTNNAPDPATNLVVSMPIPQGAVALAGPGLMAADQGWSWSQPNLDAHNSATFTASLRVTSMPPGEALVVRPQATAKGLAIPVSAVGGALVSSHAPTIKNADFTPGSDAQLTSDDNHVSVKMDAKAHTDKLKLRHAPLAAIKDELKAKGKSIPPATSGFRKGLGTFYLDATDPKGQDIHKFKAPVSIEVKYTPQQLEALGLSEGDLTLFWFDESQTVTKPDGSTEKGKWIAIPTQVDAKTRTATAQVDHFTPFQLGDGSSPSANFIPSLQGFQESLFTGGANYNYPIDLPAGPGGLKPSLQLSYASSGIDGKGGESYYTLSEWVGRGWSLDTGSIAVNRIGDEVTPYYSLVLNGQSYDLVWSGNAWRATNESFIKINRVANGNHYGVANWPAYTWQIWTKDGTRYDFTQDAWWAWDCVSSHAQYVEQEAYRWMLSKVTDTHGNTITYNYNRLQKYINDIPTTNAHPSSCTANSGTLAWNSTVVDEDIWPASITWGGNPTTGAIDRFSVVFSTTTRTLDTQAQRAPGQYGGSMKTQQLNSISVSSNANGTWQLISKYNLTYDWSIYSDKIENPSVGACSNNTIGPNVCAPKLALKSIQRVGSDGTTGLPATTFTYGSWVSTGSANDYYPNGPLNRLVTINNGQGGTITLNYETIGNFVVAYPYNIQFRNYHRLTSRVTTDGRGNSYTWSYSYGTDPAFNSPGASPQVNSLGSGMSSSGPNGNPNSAALYFNYYTNIRNNQGPTWLAHQRYTVFRGHNSTTVTNPDGSKVIHYFYQGDVGCKPAADDPNLNPPNSTNLAYIVNDPCFQQLRDREFLVGREWKTENYNAANAKLSEVQHYFTVNFLDYTGQAQSGLWRAFAYENQTVQRTYEGGTTPLTKTTKYYYDPAYQSNGVQYGNLTRTEEYDQSGALYRQTRTWFTTVDNGTNYIVDHKYADFIGDGQWRNLAQTHYLYDGYNTTLSGIGAKGELTRVLKFSNVPFQTDSGLVSFTMSGNDTTFGYDAYGNQITVTTYANPGTATEASGGGWVYSAPGNGSAARTTTTTYDTTFHVYPIQSTPPTVNGVTLSETAGYDYRMGLLTSVTDANNNATSAEYDVFGRMVKLIKPGDSSANPTVQAYYFDWNYANNPNMPYGYVYVQRDGGGGRWSSKYYDGMGRLIQTKSQSASTTQNIVNDTVFDNMSRVWKTSQPRYVTESNVWPPAPNTFLGYTSIGTDSIERWTQTGYDGAGRPTFITAPDSTVTTHQYGLWTSSSPYFNWENIVDANGHVTQKNSNEWGQLTWVKEFSGTNQTGDPWVYYAGTNYTYNPLEQLTGVTDGVGNQTAITYDSLGRKTSMKDPDMGTWNYFYDANGNLRQQTDNKGQIINFNYDALNRLTSKVLPTGQTSLLSDNFDTQNTSNWTFSGQQTVPFNDGGNNVVKNVGTGSDWNANFVRNSYSLTSGKGLQVRFKFTSLPTAQAAVLSIENNDTTYRRFGINADTSKLYVQYMNDGTNWVYPANLITNLQTNVWYVLKIDIDDTNGFVVQTWQENNPAVRGSYVYPMASGKTWRFHHWNYGQTSYLDDYQEYSTTTDTATYNYDEAGSSNGKGQRTSMSNGNAITQWQYTARGQVSQATYSGIAGLTGSRTFDWTYDTAGRVATFKLPSLTDPANVNAADRETLTYYYDAAWRQTHVCTSVSGIVCYIGGTQYNALNQPTQWAYANGLWQTWNYTSPMSRLASVAVGTTAGGSDRFNRSYTQYDNVGNVKQVTDVIPSGQTNAGTQTINYTYDHRDRLLTAVASARGTDPGYNENYSYDVIGNITAKAGVSYSYPAAGSARPHTPTSVGGQSYSYDANGNLTSGGGRDITSWNAENKPLAIIPHTGGLFQGETYLYDASGERLARTVGSTTTVYLGGVWEEDFGGSTAKRVQYQFGGQVVAQRDSSGSLIYLHNDSLGSASLATGTSQQVVSRQEFDPWGKVRANAGYGPINQTTINYTGQKLDGTGLLYYNARYYDPGIGKFISPDSIVPGKKELRPLTVDFHETGFVNGLNGENVITLQKGFWFQLSNEDRKKAKDPAGPTVPQMLNRYSYGFNNPISNNDPTGHNPPPGTPPDAVWWWTDSNKTVQAYMRPVEMDQYGWHFNLVIESYGGVSTGSGAGTIYHNYHIRYHGPQVLADGGTYWTFSIGDEKGGTPSYFFVPVGKDLPTAVEYATWDIMTVLGVSLGLEGKIPGIGDLLGTLFTGGETGVTLENMLADLADRTPAPIDTNPFLPPLPPKGNGNRNELRSLSFTK